MDLSKVCDTLNHVAKLDVFGLGKINRFSLQLLEKQNQRVLNITVSISTDLISGVPRG